MTMVMMTFQKRSKIMSGKLTASQVAEWRETWGGPAPMLEAAKQAEAEKSNKTTDTDKPVEKKVETWMDRPRLLW